MLDMSLSSQSKVLLKATLVAWHDFAAAAQRMAMVAVQATAARLAARRRRDAWPATHVH
eukprot:NODE_3606_length_764_cov_338.805360.p7 GENE.NODE_3606_length_764_cov_338.805360~~NODE_3606_length_764_cov_338.805360.p7  ORF type:complete len:59 (+),score=16.86 NODE_3606_length_764_cov_338.805360:410-586(+)